MGSYIWSYLHLGVNLRMNPFNVCFFQHEIKTFFFSFRSDFFRPVFLLLRNISKRRNETIEGFPPFFVAAAVYAFALSPSPLLLLFPSIFIRDLILANSALFSWWKKCGTHTHTLFGRCGKKEDRIERVWVRERERKKACASVCEREREREWKKSSQQKMAGNGKDSRRKTNAEQTGWPTIFSSFFLSFFLSFCLTFF